MATRHSCSFCNLVGSFSSCKNSLYRCKRCGNISQIWEVDLEILDNVQVDQRPGKTAIKTKPTVTNRIEQVLNVDSLQTRSKSSYTKYLVKWRDSLNAYCTWINEATFRNADPEYYEAYVADSTRINEATFRNADPEYTEAAYVADCTWINEATFRDADPEYTKAAYVADCTWINEATFRDADPEYYEAVDRNLRRASSSDLMGI